ncbi:hypothetical protein NDU88_001026 [Pleurodeles waltl]|uniref:CCHC-type domain-containing protein n=1 Tax=Pleurodeles waltl TaxID=8319 RepID=A0AAV7S7P3_PLEWA|nr:hypothetical protein NDU88_001026 [Pleurodeles waltl]
MSQTGHICVPPLFLDSPGKPCMKWKGWLRAFENYIVSIDGKGYSPERKKSLLFGLLGKAGQEVFDSLPVYMNAPGATTPLNEYQEAVKRLELQYAEECNIMVGRHKFALRKQEEGETIEEYIACLRVLAQDCEFAEMTDTYIRDQVVFYCYSKKVQERLLACRNPSLKEVMAIAKAVERSMMSSKELAGTSQASNVFYVQDKHKHAPKAPDRATSDRGGGRRSLACFRCGSRDHLADSRTCPALSKSCSKCRKMGHFAAVCKAKKYSTGMRVSSVSESDMDADADIVLSIYDEDGRVKGPIGSVMIGAVELPFTADSGSPITLISDRTFDLKWQDVRLHETDANPKAFGEHDIVMRGYFWDSLTFRGRTVRTKIYVAEKGRSLVGWKDLAKLGVVLVPGAEDPIVLRDDWVNYVQPEDLHEGLAEVLDEFDSVFENKWYDMREESEGVSDERLRVKERIMAKQESNKRYADNVNRAKTKNIVKGDWVLVKKPNKVMKGESVFQTPVRVQGVTRGAVCLEGRGWRSKDDIIRLKAGQEEIIMRGSRACGTESTDDEDEWQGRGARDVISSDEECVSTSPMRERIGHGSAERCEKAWRGLTDVEGQNGSRTEPAKSDNHNVMSSDQEDACAVRDLSFLNVYSLLTSRPIRIEGSRDVRGRREAQNEAARRRRFGGALAGSSWALLLVAGKE